MFKFFVAITLDTASAITGTNLKVDVINENGQVKVIGIDCGGEIQKYFVSYNKIAVFVVLTQNADPVIR